MLRFRFGLGGLWFDTKGSLITSFTSNRAPGYQQPTPPHWITGLQRGATGLMGGKLAEYTRAPDTDHSTPKQGRAKMPGAQTPSP